MKRATYFGIEVEVLIQLHYYSRIAHGEHIFIVETADLIFEPILSKVA